MTTLRQLLATWENWSARETLTRALGHVTADEHRERIVESLGEMLAPSALDALRDSAELIELLTGWQWQAVYAARQHGASWDEIGASIKTTGELAHAGYLAVLDSQEHILSRDVTSYRTVS